MLNCESWRTGGFLWGIIGTMQANETIKLITGIGKPLINKMLTYNAIDNFMSLILLLNEEAQTLLPKDEAAFLKMDYEWLCASQVDNVFEIDVVQFNNLIDYNTTIIDVNDLATFC